VRAAAPRSEAAAISPVRRRLAARSTRMPRKFVAVSARICVSPAACAGSFPAITSGRPALSRKTSASSMSALTPLPATAASIKRRNRAVRPAVAKTPPGLLT
jgi:hypothetical protein